MIDRGPHKEYLYFSDEQKNEANKFAFEQNYYYNTFMVKERYLTPYIVNDLKEKMVLVGGPRQVGQNNPFAVNLLRLIFKKNSYFNLGCNRNDREGHSRRKLADRQQIADSSTNCNKYKSGRVLSRERPTSSRMLFASL